MYEIRKEFLQYDFSDFDDGLDGLINSGKYKILIYLAFLKLKRDVYYDTTDMFLRNRLAQFESDDKFKKKLENLESLVEKQLSEGELPSQINQWIDSIDFKCLPKKIDLDPPITDEDSNIIHNIRTSSHCKVTNVNYIIDAPIELHILDVLWTMIVGKKMDAQLSDYCLGNRLEVNNDDEGQINTIQLFKIFHYQYSKWRDTAIKKAQAALDNETDILLIGLDIKQCYYHLQPDWSEVKNIYVSSNLEKALCAILENIHQMYFKKIEKYLCKTHNSASEIQGLPIGFTSSRVLCNWCLDCFDKEIQEKLHPLYYGRYVDDIIIVIQSPFCTIPIARKSIIKDLFINKGIFTKKEEEEELFITCKRDVCINKDKPCKKCLKQVHIQKDKLIIHYYDHKYSHAGLKQFSQEIAAQSSEFRFFPEGDDVCGLDDNAYDLIYKGSINKLASLIGLKENVTELSKYLSRRIIQYRLCGEPMDKSHIEQISRFFQGKNFLEFHRMWEKVFTLLLINRKDYDCAKFYERCKKIISSTYIDINEQDEDLIALTDYLRSSLVEYLSHSLAMPLSLKANNFVNKTKSKTLKKILIDFPEITNTSISFRESNVMRHQWVKYPLINYTTYDGDLLEFIIKNNLTFKWNEKNIVFSPRFVHNDEVRMLSLLYCITDQNQHPDKFIDHSKLFYKIKKIKDPTEDFCIHKDSDVNQEKDDNYQTCIKKHKLIDKDDDNKKVLVIGIANTKVNEQDIERCYKPLKSPNLSYNRQSELYDLLNESIRSPKCDLLVFPELSIPFSWMPTMVAFARKEQIGIVFGTEHIVMNKNAYNFVFTVLPYKIGNYKESFISARLKNYYAPREENDLNLYHLTAISPEVPYYEIFDWKGTMFSVFNCFELTNIAHRGLMQSEVDFLITVAWNRDISYYDHILTSTARDLHCYVIHSNTSQYGDSRVTAPMKTEEKDYVRVKGGITPTLLKAKINLDELRDFHSKRYDPIDIRFKPLPAGYKGKN